MWYSYTSGIYTYTTGRACQTLSALDPQSALGKLVLTLQLADQESGSANSTFQAQLPTASA